MSADRPADPGPGADMLSLLRPLPPGWVAPEIKELPLLTLANVLRRLQDTIEEASTIADSIDFAKLEKQAFELEEAKARWESDHPGVAYGTACGCNCGLWAHATSLCREYAEEVLEIPVVIHNYGFPPAQFYVCRPCKAAAGDT